MNDPGRNEVSEMFLVLSVCQLFYVFANVISFNLYNFYFSKKEIEVK